MRVFGETNKKRHDSNAYRHLVCVKHSVSLGLYDVVMSLAPGTIFFFFANNGSACAGYSRQISDAPKF